MTPPAFAKVFFDATGHEPFQFQQRLAEADPLPCLLQAPTGVGKTATAILAWLYRRLFHTDPDVRANTPRRLVYCLPMRTLVEQTHRVARQYLENLGRLAAPDALQQADPERVGVHMLLGGHTDEEWYLHPESNAIIVGTQDMLLSRALNRGYALSRFRWPVPFGLLNNDSFWVFDEVQLMGAAVPTSAQMEAFRQHFSTFGPSASLWMSATLQPDWLQTVDHLAPSSTKQLQPDDCEKQASPLRERLKAVKVLSKLNLNASVGQKPYPRNLALEVLREHEAGTMSLVVLNTVDRARELYRELQRSDPATEVLLVHSRFRPGDRRQIIDQLESEVDTGGPGRIVVTTQVLEAGVDVSAALLVTELAPWASIVQRLGRLNRYGEHEEARVFWVDVPERASAPYTPEAMGQAREQLESLEGSSLAPAHLPAVALEREQDEHVLRRRDLEDLFDTTPDISGNDTDVSRFIRNTTETDVYVCWREWERTQDPPPDWPRPEREELCSAPVWQARNALQEEERKAWSWDHLNRRWRQVGYWELWPGQVLVLRSSAGGYTPEMGWDPKSGAFVDPVPAGAEVDPEAAVGSNPETYWTGSWQTIAEHSREVAQEIQYLLPELPFPQTEPPATDLVEAAFWHDWGKAHEVFQDTLLQTLDKQNRKTCSRQLWAKAPRGEGATGHGRPHFRHELASMLALLRLKHQGLDPGPALSDLALYLVAAHHGRVRLGVRSYPGGEGTGQVGGERVVLGIKEGENLPGLDLGNGRKAPGVELDLSPVAIGVSDMGPSWLDRALSLQKEWGPFRLAYLEALLRAVDARVSRRATMKGGV